MEYMEAPQHSPLVRSVPTQYCVQDYSHTQAEDSAVYLNIPCGAGVIDDKDSDFGSEEGVYGTDSSEDLHTRPLMLRYMLTSGHSARDELRIPKEERDEAMNEIRIPKAETVWQSRGARTVLQIRRASSGPPTLHKTLNPRTENPNHATSLQAENANEETSKFKNPQAESLNEAMNPQTENPNKAIMKEQEHFIERLKQENQQLQSNIVQQQDVIKQKNQGLQNKLVQDQLITIEKLRQENKELQDELIKVQELIVDKLRLENHQLQNKLAQYSMFTTVETQPIELKTENSEAYRRDRQKIKDVSGRGHDVTTLDHRKFIPVKDLLLTHLPACYQHDDMSNLIKSLADITVKIHVNNVVRMRNHFWDTVQRPELARVDTTVLPGSINSTTTMLSDTMSYDFVSLSSAEDGKTPEGMSNDISSDVVLGSGKVDDVFFRTSADGPCPCHKKCQEWGEIRVLTSAKLMYDDDDAKHFVCTFFYDDEEQMDQLKYARGDRIVLRDLKKDVCMFVCVTCDVELVRTLEGMLDKFEQSWENAFDKYVDSVKWENERLTVIVSHPHGFKKHISLGKALTPNDESSVKQIAYDNPTCKGSTGAYVLIPDFNVNDDI